MPNASASPRRQNAGQLAELGHGAIVPLLFRFAWPALVTMSLHVLYNIVDRIYIGQGCGGDAIAGLSLTAPIAMALGAVGVFIGAGSSSILSIKLGEGDMDGAERTVGQLVAMKLLFGLVVPPLVYFFGLDPILSLMTGDKTSPAAFAYAHQYVTITIFFNLFAHLAFGLSAVIRSEGAPRASMLCMMVGALTNLILDPLFIYQRIPVTFWVLERPLLTIPGLGLKVAGAAWATNLSMMLSCACALAYYLRGKSVVKLRLRRIRLYGDLAGRVLAIGLAPFLMQLTGSLINFSLNHSLAHWSSTPEEGTVQIAAFGIYMSAMFLFGMPAHGIQQGLAPIVGYNWGARDYRRVRRAFDMGLLLTAAATVLACLGAEVFARPLARCFSDDPAVIGAAVRGLRVANAFFWTIFVNVAATTYYQATERPRMSILFSLLRQCLVLLPVVWILPRAVAGTSLAPWLEAHSGMSACILCVWVAMPASDLVTQLVNLPFVFRERRRLREMASRHEPIPFPT